MGARPAQEASGRGRGPHEPTALGLVVICAGGMMDAYSYLLHGGVFATGQTGNLVLLVLRALDGNLPGAAGCLVSILSFLTGIFLSKHLRARVCGGDAHRAQRVVIVAEALVFALVALLPAGAPDLLVNCVIAFMAALSFQNFRTFGTKSVYASTFITGNLRSLGETLYDGIVGGDAHELHRAQRYAGLVAAFAAGVVMCWLLIGLVGRLACLAMSALFLAARPLVADSGERA